MIDNEHCLGQLYQLWTKTTSAGENDWLAKSNDLLTGYWIMLDNLAPGRATTPRQKIASFLFENDAAFVAAAHALLPEIFDQYLANIDCIEVLDTTIDELHDRIRQLELRINELTSRDPDPAPAQALTVPHAA